MDIGVLQFISALVLLISVDEEFDDLHFFEGIDFSAIKA